MRIKDVIDKWCVVKRVYWERYGKRAFVERICDSEEEARYVKNSLERCDGIDFVIIKGGKEI